MNEIVEINHAQHFGIAQSLAKRWGQTEWEKRLLVIVASIDDKTQKKIEKDLSQKRLRSAQQKEKAAISIQTEAEYRLYMNKLKQRPPAASRWKLVEALDKKSAFSQLIISTREQVYQEISNQVKDWQPPANWQQEAKQEVFERLGITAEAAHTVTETLLEKIDDLGAVSYTHLTLPTIYSV